MARASSRPTSVQLNTTKQFWLWCLAAYAWQCAYVFTPSVGYKPPSSTVNGTCNKIKDTVQKIVGAHLTSHPHIKIGCTPVRLTWEDHLSLVFHSEKFDEQASITSLPVLTWLLLNPRAQRYFLTFRFGVPRAVRCTWTEWQWKLVHSPCQHLTATCFRNYWRERVSCSIQHICRTRWSCPQRSLRAYHEFSTFVRWLSYVDISWLLG